MGFCPRCGAPTSESMAFCTSCGQSLAMGAPLPPPSAGEPTPFVPSVPRAGPSGTTREPWIVLLLSFVTLGIYSLVFWWQSSKEVDAYAQKPGHSHQFVRVSTFLFLIGGVLALFFVVNLLGDIATWSDPGPGEAQIMGAILGAVGMFLLLAAVGLAATVLHLIGRYRLWEMLEGAQRERGETQPLSTGLMLGLSIAAYFVPFLGLVFRFIVLYMTQEHMNKLWAR